MQNTRNEPAFYRTLTLLDQELDQLRSQLRDLTNEEDNGHHTIKRLTDVLRGRHFDDDTSREQQDIKSLEQEVSRIGKKRAELREEISRKEQLKYQYEADIFREEGRIRGIEAAQQARVMATVDRVKSQIAATRTEGGGVAEYDLFISHATEDKDTVARPLAEKMRAMGIRVWYDEFTLKVGESLSRSIDKGLAGSRFGLVILSPSFFAKEWPRKELDGLVTRETSLGSKIVLPIWHKVSKDEVMAFSPTLADKVALNTSDLTIDEIVDQLTGEIKGGKS